MNRRNAAGHRTPVAALLIAVFYLIAAIPASQAAPSTGAPTHLRCEMLDTPLGLDAPRLRLSWWLVDARRGARQTAYRLQVASSPDRLRAGRTDVWDSGRVASSRSSLVPYGGPRLRSRQACWWRVQTWDANGVASPPSEPARWEMGLLTPGDWRARWIGRSGNGEMRDSLADVKWIWYPEGDPHTSAPSGTRWFRAAFETLPGKTVRQAALLAAADNSFTAYLNGRSMGGGADWQSLHTIPVTEQIREGRNALLILGRNEGGPAGLAAALKISYEDGTVQRVATGADWKAYDGFPEGGARGASTADYDDASWKGALIVAGMGDAPWGMPVVGASGGPATLLRRDFTVRPSVRRARVYVTALGSYRLHINGQRVGRDCLTPDWTDYRQRVSYQTYDVTNLLRPGANAIGAIVGDGWYASGLGWNLQRFSFGSPPVRLLLQLHVEYADGRQETIASGSGWKATAAPVLRSEIYAGETFDARKMQPGWDRPGFDDASWQPADVLESGRIALSAQVSPPIRVTQELRPRAITEPSPGVFVFDMGQNMPGWVRLRVQGPAGTTVRLRFAEILKPDGNIYRDNLRRAEATDSYTLRGGGEEVWEPLFTYHGFRYVEVTGFPGRPTLGALTGRVAHTDVRPSGSLVTSSEMVNRLWQNIDWGQRANLFSVPTDCPQRDERLGWMGDAQIFWLTACYNRDMSAFTAKWVRDIREAQSRDGGFSDVSPRVVDMADGAPGWGDAGIIVPYVAWKQYGDLEMIRAHWDAMAAWLRYIGTPNTDFVWRRRRNNDFGDWVPANSDTPRDVIATAYWAADAAMMEEMALALGRIDKARLYHMIHDNVRAAFIRAFVKPDGTVGNGSQTCQAMALCLGLVPADLRSAAAAKLVADIEARGGHLSTGFLGTPFLLPALSETGHNDTAYRLLLNRTYPSWGYTIDKGATTIWERWNGDTGDPGMNSFNHFAFGSVGEWLYRTSAGIGADPRAPGFQRLVIRPRPDARLTRVRGTYETPYGRAESEWARMPGGPLVLRLVVPANTTAEVWVPCGGPTRVLEGGRSASSAPGVRFQREEAGCAVYAVGAGSYRFTASSVRGAGAWKARK